MEVRFEKCYYFSTALTLREQCWDSSLLRYLLRDSSVGSWWILMQYLQLMTGKCWPHISSWQIHQFNDKYSRETALQSLQHIQNLFWRKNLCKIHSIIRPLVEIRVFWKHYWHFFFCRKGLAAGGSLERAHCHYRWCYGDNDTG